MHPGFYEERLRDGGEWYTGERDVWAGKVEGVDWIFCVDEGLKEKESRVE